MTKTKRILVIFPKILEEKKQDYVKDLLEIRHDVRCLLKDTNPIDQTGLTSAEELEKAIIWAEKIHIWFTDSKGSTFILGQVRMANWFQQKKLVVINKDKMTITEQNSFENICLATHFKLESGCTFEKLLEKINKQKGRD